MNLIEYVQSLGPIEREACDAFWLRLNSEPLFRKRMERDHSLDLLEMKKIIDIVEYKAEPPYWEELISISPRTLIYKALPAFALIILVNLKYKTKIPYYISKYELERIIRALFYTLVIFNFQKQNAYNI